MAILQGSAYNATASCSSHIRSDWQIAADPDFNVIVAESINDGASLENWLATLDPNDPNVIDKLLFARVRYKSNTCISEWSDTRICVSGSPPAGTVQAPNLVVQGQPLDIPTGPQLVAGAFNVLDTNTGATLFDIHESTDWQVIDNTGTLVWSSTSDTENLTSIFIPDGTLIPGNSYTFRVRYNGQHYGAGNITDYIGTILNGPFIEPPTLTVEGAPSNVPSDPTLTGSPFIAIGGNIVHTSSDWIIEDNNGAVIWSEVLVGDPHLTTIKLPLGTLQQGQQYVVKLRYSGLDSITNQYVNSQYVTVNIYADFSGKWKVMPLSPAGKKAHGQVTLSNGDVWIAGGLDENGLMINTGYTLQLDYINGGGLWVPGPNLFAANRNMQMTQDGLGNIFISGGFESTVNGDVVTVTTYSYNPGTDNWVTRAPLPTPRFNHRQTLLTNNTLLITGGFDGTAILDSCYIYNPSQDTYLQTTPLPIPLHGHGQCLVNGIVYVTGGLTDTGQSDRIFAYDVISAVWSEVLQPSTPLNPNTPQLLPSPRYFHIQEPLDDHRFMISAGRNDIGIMDSTFIFDETADPRFIPVDHMPIGREHGASSILTDNTILVTGGSSNGSDALVIPYRFI
jgi:hypothetical protein